MHGYWVGFTYGIGGRYGIGRVYTLRHVTDQLVLIVTDEWAWQGLELVMGYMSYY